MGWYPDSATSAYLDTIKLCRLDHERRYTSARHSEPHSTEFISALAAGMNAKLILQADSLLNAMVAMKELGLAGYVEFIVGDAEEIIPQHPGVDFALIDCKQEDYVQLFDHLKLNPARAVVVADNLFDRKATAAYGRIVRRQPGARSITLPIGKGIEVTRLSKVEQRGLKSEAEVATDDKPVAGRLRVSWACVDGDEPRRPGRKSRFRIE